MKKYLGWSIVFTGPAKLDGVHIERSLLIERAKEAGCFVQSKVDHQTDYVVASSPDFKNGQGHKLRDAKKYGTKVISLATFLEMLK